MTTDKDFYKRLITYNQSPEMTAFPDDPADVTVQQPVVPDKNPDKWESKAQPYTNKLSELEKQWLQISQDADDEYEKLVTDLTPTFGIDPMGMGIAVNQPDIGAGVRARVNRDSRAKINDISNQVEYNSFYQSLYSTTPYEIELARQLAARGKAEPPTTDSIMAGLNIPKSVPATERSNIQAVVEQMIGITEETDNAPLTPALVAPVASTSFPVVMSQLTGAEIAKSLMTPTPPESSWTTAQFNNLLLESGQIAAINDDEMAAYLQDRANELTASKVQRDLNIAQMKEAGALLPSRTFLQYMTEFAIEPMAAIGELMMPYFEHTTMPWSESIVSGINSALGMHNMENLRQHYMAQGMTSRQARVKVWEVSNPPGPAATDFILKQVLAETITDPLTLLMLVAGLTPKLMVLAGRGAAAAGSLGRAGAVVARVSPALYKGSQVLSRTGLYVGKVIDYPFDWMKGVGELIPKTAIQRAEVFSTKSVTAVTAYVTGEVAVKIDGKLVRLAAAPLYTRTKREFDAIITSAIDITLRRGDTNTPAVKAGRALLAHKSISEEDVIDWASKLGTTLRKGDDLTMMRMQMDELFELYFKRVESTTKLLDAPAMSSYMVKILTGNAGDSKSLHTAQLLLESRTRSIIRNARNLGDTPQKAMSALTKRNHAISLAIDDIAADVGRLHQNHSSRLLTIAGDISTRSILTWRNTIDAWITRPFSQSYLAFALYGPFNMLEDMWRSWMGDVNPGIMSADDIAMLTVGLEVEEALRHVSAKGIVEQTGQVITTKKAYAGWKGTPHGYVLDRLASFGFGFGEKWATVTMDWPGQISMGIRRNFWGAKFQDIMYQNGGDIVKSLHTLVTDYHMPTNVHTRLQKQLQTVAYRYAIGGTSESMRNAASMFTRKKIMRRDLNAIKSRHAEVPVEVWDDLFEKFDDNSLFTDIDASMTGAKEVAIQSFLKGPERFTESMNKLTNLFMSMEIQSPEDMANLVNALRYASEMAGATPKQILARATVYSRRLPFEQRRAVIDPVLDNINQMIDDAGVNIGKLEGKIRQTMNTPDQMGTPEIAFTGISAKFRSEIEDIVNNLPIEMKLNVKGFAINRKLPNPASYNANTGIITFQSVGMAKDMDYFNMYHELSHDFVESVIKSGDMEPLQSWFESVPSAWSNNAEVQATIKSGNIAVLWDKYTDMMEAVVDSLAINLQTRHGITPVLKVTDAELSWANKFFPNKQRNLGYSPDHIAAANRLLDLQTAKRLALSTRAKGINISRQDYWATVSRADLKSRADEVYDEFYRQADGWWDEFNVEAATFDAQIAQQFKAIDRLGGNAVDLPPVKVTGTLCANDIANVMGCRGDDISSNLLSAMIPQNDRRMFIEYVWGHVRPGIDEGFTKDGIGKVYDQIWDSLHVGNDGWMSRTNSELEAVRSELHDLNNAGQLKPDELYAIKQYFDGLADEMDNILGVKAPVNIPESEVAQAKQKYADIRKLSHTIDDLKTIASGTGTIKVYHGAPSELADLLVSRGANVPYKAEDVARTIAKKYGIAWDDFKQLAYRQKEVVTKLSTSTPEVASRWAMNFPQGERATEFNNQARLLVEAKKIKRSNETLMQAYDRYWDEIAKPKLDAQGKGLDYGDSANRLGLPDKFRLSGKGSLVEIEVDVKDLPALTRQSAKRRLEDISEGNTPEAESLQSWAEEYQDMVIDPSTIKSSRIVVSDIPSRTNDIVSGDITRKMGIVGTKPEYASYQQLRQQSADEASKWYYKEYTDYTHGNAVDSFMKLIYPFWTYESQRWFWLPRSFIRKPATFTALNRFQNNSDNGYIHVPGTSWDVSPFRGTIYGALTGRLSKRDYPDYYDQLGILGDIEGFSDMVSRYGFYPGAYYSLAMTALGGEPLWGEQIPAVFKTPMDLLRVALPGNKTLEWIDSRVMGDRFRDYMTATVMTRMGVKGSLILAKLNAKEELTPEEQQIFTDARREVSWYSILFEQFSVFRLRPEEYLQIQENCAQLIQELYGFTPEQQEEARARGINLADLVGGMSKQDLAMLEELGYYKYSGRARPLLPQSQQAMQNKLELAWSKVEEYSATITAEEAEVERLFLTGKYTNDDYTKKLRDLQDKQHNFVLDKMRENTVGNMDKDLTLAEQEEWIETHSLMSLEGKKEYLKLHKLAVPVTEPMTELLHLYYSIKLREVTNPETGRLEDDWDSYWLEKQVIENAIPDQYKSEWTNLTEGDWTPLRKLRKEVYTNYFTVYNGVYDAVLKGFTPDEQRAINEFYYLKGTNRNIDRQNEIQDMVSAKTGNKLISSYSTEIGDVRKQLRYANPMLDAWLYFWGKTSTLLTPQAEDAYKQIAKRTGRAM